MHYGKEIGKIFMKKKQATQKHEGNNKVDKVIKYSGKGEDGEQRARKCKFCEKKHKPKIYPAYA